MRDRTGDVEGVIWRWLEAEIGSLERRAEERLGEVFAAVPRPAPSARLAIETLARLGAGRRTAVRRPALAFRLVAAACLAAAGAAAVLLPAALPAWLAAVVGGEVVGWASGAVIGLAQRLGEAAIVWRLLGVIAETVAQTVQSPRTLAVLALSLASSFASLRALTSLVAGERRETHA